jgi:hypothetical protein
MIIDCDLEITRTDGDEDEEPIITGLDEETQKSREIPKLEPKAQWPFSNSDFEETAKWPFDRPKEGGE